MEAVDVVVGGQAGSEGKGAIVGALHKLAKYDAAIRVGGPNAGHTVYDDEGRRFALRQIPVAAVVDHDCQLVIAPGSEVDMAVLYTEIQMLEQAGHPVRQRLLIDGEATVIQPKHQAAEKGIQNGTTGKGIGGARAARAMRDAVRMCDIGFMDLHTVDTVAAVREMSGAVMLEGTQGYWLGSHAGYYPHCTSGDCKVTDMLAMSGLPPYAPRDTWVVLRSHPIRIAGNSGPLNHETTWDAIGVPPERTTVTNLERRVGEWDWEWAEKSVKANTGHTRPLIALTFADYWWPEIAGWSGNGYELRSDMKDMIARIEEVTGGRVGLVGTGPTTQLTGGWH